MRAPLEPRRLTRRSVIGSAAIVGGIGALGARSSSSAPTFTPRAEAHAFAIAIDATSRGKPVPRRVLGSNVGWAFGGDNMLAADGQFAPAMLDMARRLGPTVLRYPGGTYSDVFHWEAATNEHVFNRMTMPTLMDTQRFLELCEALGAEPLITVNVPTGSVDEAVRWLTATNLTGMRSRLTGRRLPRVTFWEIGNEPYLKESSRQDIDLVPDEFARRANRFIRALRAVDPTILIGLPLTTDTRGGVPVTPYPGFTRTVLEKVTESFDYACLHNAYMPFGFDRGLAPADMYWGAAAGALTVQKDLSAMARLLADLRPGVPIKLAVTEYSALFSLGRGETDSWITTPAGAIYLADVLRVFAQTPGFLLATHWSLSANWLFGAIHAEGHARPAYQVLQLMGEALQGDMVPLRLDAATVAVRGVGQVAAVDAMPLVEALATCQTAADKPGRRTLRLFLINKDPERAGVGRLAHSHGRVEAARMSLLSARDVFDASDTSGVLARTESAFDAARPIEIRLPPHSIALITLDLSIS